MPKFTNEFVSNVKTAKKQEELYDTSFNHPGSFGLRISVTGSKRFFLVYNFGGKRKRVTLGRHPEVSLEFARRRAERLSRMVKLGKPPQSKRRIPESFAEVAELFLARHATIKCSPRTVKEYRRILDRELLPFWKDEFLDRIEAKDIFDLVDGVATRGSPVMAARTRALIGSIFSFAESRHLIRRNEASELKLPSFEKNVTERILSQDEIFELWRLCGEVPGSSGSLMQLLIITGQRLNDVLSMRWSDIELDTWVVKRGQASEFRIPLSPLTMQIIRNLRNAQTERHEFLFPKRGGGHLLHVGKLVATLNRRHRWARPWNPRDIRRSVRVHLHDLKLRPELVEMMLGNKTLSRFARKAVAATSGGGDFDYSDEMRAGFMAWSRKLAAGFETQNPPDGSGKVVTIFR